MTACCLSACSLKDGLIRQAKLALVQCHVNISPWHPAMDIAMVEGWEASALCCVIHMHPESTA